jgi:hypothetical protein
MLKQAPLIAMLALASASSHAGGLPPSGISPFVGVGITYGGDQIGNTVNYTNGDSSKLQAGSLIDLRAGVEYQAIESPLSFQLSLGYHVDDTLAAKNGSASFSRFPLEVLAHYLVADTWRIGAGVRKALGAETSSSGNGTGYVYAQKYSSSTGFILEGEYLPTRHIGIKIRAVNETYTPQTYGKKVDGSHVGVIGVFYFR